VAVGGHVRESKELECIVDPFRWLADPDCKAQKDLNRDTNNCRRIFVDILDADDGDGNVVMMLI
jgi:hypothetical protein